MKVKVEMKARDMQVGDGFLGFGKVKDFVIEGGQVWARIGAAKHLFAFDADMDIVANREV